MVIKSQKVQVLLPQRASAMQPWMQKYIHYTPQDQMKINGHLHALVSLIFVTAFQVLTKRQRGCGINAPVSNQNLVLWATQPATSVYNYTFIFYSKQDFTFSCQFI